MLTTITIFTLRPGQRRWGLAQMGTSPGTLKRVPGLRFFQLLGSGAAWTLELVLTAGLLLAFTLVRRFTGPKKTSLSS